MSHIFTEDGKQWKLIPELPQLMEVQGQAGHIIMADNQQRMDETKANALPIVNPHILDASDFEKVGGLREGKLYEWPGMWELIDKEGFKKTEYSRAKLIAPQQPQVDKKIKSHEQIWNESCFNVAKKFGLGTSLVTGHKATYWHEAAMTAMYELEKQIKHL